MKILKQTTLKNGKIRLAIEIDAGEGLPTEAINLNRYYRLNEPMDEMIVIGDIISRPRQVYWLSDEQRWETV